jgi:chromosome segregation ATPase
MEKDLQPKLDQLEQQLLYRDRDLQQTRDEAELTLLQLHQVQEELEQLFLTDRQKQQLLDSRSGELQSLQAHIHAMEQEFQPKLDQLEQQLHNRDHDLQQTRDEAELTLLQLHQVQEELERYFLQSRAGSQLVEAQADQLNRAKRLLSKLSRGDLSQRDAVATVAVEVLPAYQPTSQQPSLQVQALLNTYASNLDRANALLTKAMSR